MTTKQAQPPAAAAWRQFPQLEKLFEPEKTEPALRAMEKTCRRLEEIAAQGAKADQERARAALGAYSRTFQLVRELADLRNRMAEASGSK